jgi:hypothetical protein
MYVWEARGYKAETGHVNTSLILPVSINYLVWLVCIAAAGNQVLIKLGDKEVDYNQVGGGDLPQHHIAASCQLDL